MDLKLLRQIVEKTKDLPEDTIVTVVTENELGQTTESNMIVSSMAMTMAVDYEGDFIDDCIGLNVTFEAVE